METFVFKSTVIDVSCCSRQSICELVLIIVTICFQGDTVEDRSGKRPAWRILMCLIVPPTFFKKISAITGL